VPTTFGATNPFFLRSRIPGLSTVALSSQDLLTPLPSTVATTQDQRLPRKSSLLPTVSSTATALSSLFNSSSPSPADALSGCTDGLWLSFEGTCAGANKSVLAKVKPGHGRSLKRSLSRATSNNSNLLRAHFYELTTSFLAPFALFCGVYPPWDARAEVCSGRGHHTPSCSVPRTPRANFHELITAWSRAATVMLQMYGDPLATRTLLAETSG
jgi:hypothetical protein